MTLDDVAAVLEARLPNQVSRDASVAELTTYRVGGPAAVLVRIGDEAALRTLASVLTCSKPPILLIGRGSNLLVAEAGFHGVAVVLEDDFAMTDVDSETNYVRAGGAVPLPMLARRAAAAGVGGLEFFVGIPGSVGGAVRMNAGGHGRETADVLHRAWVLDLFAGTDAVVVARDVGALDLSYRHSNVDAAHVVVRAEFAGEPDDVATCEDRIAEIGGWRGEHQPGGSTGGSVSRNPPGDSAGRLIDEAGLKGLRVGGAVVSEKHANFFQAEPDATADDVARLVETVRARVADATGVQLVTELRMIGFDGPDDRALRGERRDEKEDNT